MQRQQTHYNSIIRIIAFITLSAFLATQVAWGYEESHIRAQAAPQLRSGQAGEGNAAGEVANALGGEARHGENREERPVATSAIVRTAVDENSQEQAEAGSIGRVGKALVAAGLAAATVILPRITREPPVSELIAQVRKGDVYAFDKAVSRAEKGDKIFFNVLADMAKTGHQGAFNAIVNFAYGYGANSVFIKDKAQKLLADLDPGWIKDKIEAGEASSVSSLEILISFGNKQAKQVIGQVNPSKLADNIGKPEGNSASALRALASNNNKAALEVLIGMARQKNQIAIDTLVKFVSMGGRSDSYTGVPDKQDKKKRKRLVHLAKNALIGLIDNGDKALLLSLLDRAAGNSDILYIIQRVKLPSTSSIDENYLNMIRRLADFGNSHAIKALGRDRRDRHPEVNPKSVTASAAGGAQAAGESNAAGEVANALGGQARRGETIVDEYPVVSAAAEGEVLSDGVYDVIDRRIIDQSKYKSCFQLLKQLIQKRLSRLNPPEEKDTAKLGGALNADSEELFKALADFKRVVFGPREVGEFTSQGGMCYCASRAFAEAFLNIFEGHEVSLIINGYHDNMGFKSPHIWAVIDNRIAVDMTYGQFEPDYQCRVLVTGVDNLGRFHLFERDNLRATKILLIRRDAGGEIYVVQTAARAGGEDKAIAVTANMAGRSNKRYGFKKQGERFPGVEDIGDVSAQVDVEEVLKVIGHAAHSEAVNVNKKAKRRGEESRGGQRRIGAIRHDEKVAKRAAEAIQEAKQATNTGNDPVETAVRQPQSLTAGQALAAGADTASDENQSRAGGAANTIAVTTNMAGRYPEWVREMARRGLTYEEACLWRESKVKGQIKKLPNGFWHSQKTAKNFIFSALDTIPGFKEARETNDIKTMADLYRGHVIKNGQQAFFHKMGLAGLMVKGRDYLKHKKDSPAALLRFALPGLIDLINPDALDPLEVENYYWTDPNNAIYHICCALDTIDGFKKAREDNDIKTMAELYKKHVLEGYKNKGGQIAFFCEKGRLSGLIWAKAPYFSKRASPAEMLRLAAPGLIDDDNPDALHSYEVESMAQSPKAAQEVKDEEPDLSLLIITDDIIAAVEERKAMATQLRKSIAAEYIEVADANDLESSEVIERLENARRLNIQTAYFVTNPDLKSKITQALGRLGISAVDMSEEAGRAALAVGALDASL